MPPPTVNGIETRSATRAATSTAEPRDVDRRGDVEEHELVRARVGVRGAELDGIADVAQLAELDALDDAAARDVEARDQTRERHCSRKRAPAAPLFSGWNCTPVNAPSSTTATKPSLVAVAASSPRRTSARTSTPRRPGRRRPADARHALRAQPDGAAGHEAEPRRAAVLLALVERDLEAEADAERRAARGGALAQRVVEPALAQSRHRRAGRADAGENREIGVEHVGGCVGRDDLRAEPLERELDGADVARAVAADRDVHRIPFVDGTRPPSSREAPRAAHGPSP